MPETVSTYAMVLTTCGSRDNAQTIARELVTQGLAACVQMFPIESVYKWQGAVEEAQELMLFCKIKSENYSAAEALILKLHSYETPEVIQIAIDNGAPAYLQWIAEMTR